MSAVLGAGMSGGCGYYESVYIREQYGVTSDGGGMRIYTSMCNGGGSKIVTWSPSDPAPGGLIENSVSNGSFINDPWNRYASMNAC